MPILSIISKLLRGILIQKDHSLSNPYKRIYMSFKNYIQRSLMMICLTKAHSLGLIQLLLIYQLE